MPTTITVTAKTGAGDRLFGSVTTSEIAEAIAAQTGIEIDPHKLHLDEPIKTLGTHMVPAKLHATSSSRSPSRSFRRLRFVHSVRHSRLRAVAVVNDAVHSRLASRNGLRATIVHRGGVHYLSAVACRELDLSTC